MTNEQKTIEKIDYSVYNELYSLMGCGRVPTKLGLDRFIRGLGYTLPSTANREAEGKIDDILHRPYDGDGSWINGEYKVRLALHERISLRDQLCSLISPPMEVLSESDLDYYWRKGLAKEGDHQDAARAVSQATINKNNLTKPTH